MSSGKTSTSPGVDADTELEPQASRGIPYRQSAPQGTGRASEHHEEAVPGGVDLASSEPIELRANDSVVLREQLLPGGLSKSGRGRCGIDDVGHEQGRYQALVLARHTDGSDIAEHVDQYDGLVPHDPGIVSRRSVEHIARPEIGGLPIVHLHVEATGQHQREMVDLAGGCALDRLQGCRPAPTWLEYAATDGQ